MGFNGKNSSTWIWGDVLSSGLISKYCWHDQNCYSLYQLNFLKNIFSISSLLLHEVVCHVDPSRNKIGFIKNSKTKLSEGQEKLDSLSLCGIQLHSFQCMTANGRKELTRIAVVDENLDCIYETLVKPNAVITDYLTRSALSFNILKGHPFMTLLWLFYPIPLNSHRLALLPPPHTTSHPSLCIPPHAMI